MLYGNISNNKVTNTEPLQDLCDHWNCTDDDCKLDKAEYEKELQSAIDEATKRPPGALRGMSLFSGK
jgi:hypothetical protein